MLFRSPSEERTNVWPELRLLLGTNATNLAELRRSLDAPVLEFPVRYEDGVRALLPHLSKAKGTVQLLRPDAARSLIACSAAFSETNSKYSCGSFARA